MNVAPGIVIGTTEVLKELVDRTLASDLKGLGLSVIISKEEKCS